MSLGRVEELLDVLGSTADPEVQLAVRELVAVLLEAHGEGLSRLLRRAAEEGIELDRALLGDPVVTDLLLLHGLHPEPLAVRAEAAVAALRTDLGAAGAALRLVAVDGGTVELSLPGVEPATGTALLERFRTAVPDADDVVLRELPRRHLLPVVPGAQP